jgi:hypothetical protein
MLSTGERRNQHASNAYQKIINSKKKGTALKIKGIRVINIIKRPNNTKDIFFKYLFVCDRIDNSN